MEVASFIIAIISAALSVIIYIHTVIYDRRKATIEAINLLQNEVLDKFVSITKENAKVIVENLDDVKCKEAYNDYRALIARLEHFAVGVKKHVYSYNVVKALLGNHFIHLYSKVALIINEANKSEKSTKHYCNFEKLVKKIKNNQLIKK